MLAVLRLRQQKTRSVKKLFTLAGAAMLTITAQAQITLNQSDFTAWTPGVDSFREFTTPMVTPVTNGSWDMSTANYTGGPFTIPKIAYTNAAVPGASYYTNGGYNFSAFTVPVKVCYGINGQGYGMVGEVIDRTAYSLAPVTTNTQDSLVFLAQATAYSSTRKNLSFPATYNSNWMSAYVFNTNFQVTITAYGLNNAPGYKRATVVKKDTVSGWGKVKVKKMDGITSGWMDVLAVKSHMEIVDSFFLNGAPAPPTLLSMMGITQGTITRYYRIAYYRAGEIEPVTFTEFTDATYTVLKSADVHLNRLPLAPTHINTPGNQANNISVYPNPAAGNGYLNIEVTETATGTWRYALFNTAGQVLHSDVLKLNGRAAQIAMSQTPAGQYFLSISKDGQSVATKPVMIGQ